LNELQKAIKRRSILWEPFSERKPFGGRFSEARERSSLFGYSQLCGGKIEYAAA
jgi:hypothetical protein